MGRCTRSRAIVRVITEFKPGREGTEGEGGHREEIITTETQRTRSYGEIQNTETQNHFPFRV
jgi:hypothetical protein